MNVLLFLLWFKSLDAAYGSSYSNFIAVESAHPCPGINQCKTLEFYASNAYFTDNTSFIFLPGIHVLGNISIPNVSNVILMASTEGNVTIQCNGSGGLVFQNASNVVLANLSFVSCGQPLPHSLQREGETAQAALAFGQVTDLQLESVSVSHSRGYGLLGHCVHGDFNITNSHFTSNKGSGHYLGGNAAIEYIDCTSLAAKSNVLISSSTFSRGGYDSYTENSTLYATGLLLILSHSNISVTISDVCMESNENDYYRGFGGNMLIHAFTPPGDMSNSVTISNSRFVNGTSWLGAGVGVSFFGSGHSHSCATVHFTFHKCEMSHNTGIGSGLYYEFQMVKPHYTCLCVHMTVKNSVFDGNTLKIESMNHPNFFGEGVAAHLLAKYYGNTAVEKIKNHYKTNFDNCVFNNSQLVVRLENRTANTKLAVTVMTMRNINMDSSLTNCEIADNVFPGIGISNSKIKVSGNIVIRNNTGMNGGGMLLCESSYLILTRDTNVSFINNHAVQLGGGIYIEGGCLHTKPFCFYQPDYNDEWDCANISKSTNIVMINNTAGYAGQHLFGGGLDNCKIFKCSSLEVFPNLFRLSPNETEHTYLSAVTSRPTKICFCDDKQNPNCTLPSTTKVLHENKYPGEMVSFDIVSVGQFNGTVPGTVLYHIEYSDLKPEVGSTLLNCTTFRVPIITNETKEVKINLQLTSNLYFSSENITYLSVSEPLVVYVKLKKCPPGFNQSNGSCECETKLNSKQISCDISTNTITRTPPAWIGYDTTTSESALSTGLIYHEVCPYDYCLPQSANITSNDALFGQDSQCGPNRTGLLCSRCKDGLTLSFGTSDCMECDNKVALPLSLIGYPLFGIALVLLLVVFDTYSDGTFCGLLFYANVINLYDFIFLPRDQVNRVVRALISWMSLNIGFESCIYSGMDSYAKTWLNFCFPLYLFLLTAAIIMLVRKSRKVAGLFGGKTVNVLAALLLLSYTKLIQNTMTALSATIVHYPSNNVSRGIDRIVWTSDPTLEYFSGKHIPLALVAIVFGLLILAFTMVLLCVQPLQRYSHLRCFSWMAKIKPFIDAYTAPHIINDNCRYWEGLLLFFRLILAILLETNVKNDMNVNLKAIFCVCVLLLTIAWCVGGVYKKTHLNIINSSYVLNLTLLTITIYGHGEHQLPNPARFRYIAYSSYFIAISTMCGIVAYHGYSRVKRWYVARRRSRYQELPADDIDTDYLHNMRHL